MKEILPTLDKNLNRWDLKSVKRDHDNSFNKNIPDADSKKNHTIKKILPVALGDRNGPWPTFCCLGHSDVNSHFKNFNTSNTSLTLGEPHKPKHTLSTLPPKHDSMCHRKTCIGQKIITENAELSWQGIPSF